MNLSNLMPGESRKKISRLLCVTALSTCSVFAYAQQQQVKLTGSNLPLKSVFKQIEKQTDLSIDYRSQDVDDSRIVKQMPKATTVQQAMNQLLAGTDCVVTFSNGHIIIKKQASNTTNQQSKLVKGTIVDATGMPVIGANVMVKGTTNGTITDMDGKFSLDVDEGATLVVSYIGFANQEIKVGNQTNLSITMKEDAEALDELVVVGYGTQKKVNLTGAVSSVSNNEISVTKNENVVNMLSGKLPGVRITQNSAQPGSYDTNIDIRGLGTPLVVIDGVSRSMADFTRLSPEEIESVSVLKDASAAIYGLRSANGVILVTTKSGTKEGKVDISYSFNYGFQQFLNVPNTVGALDYMMLKNEQQWTNVSTNYFNKQQAYWSEEAMKPYLEGKPSYNWMDALFRNTAGQYEHNLGINGGSEKINYYFNLSYMNQEGSLKNKSLGYDRWNIRSNINAKITENLSAKLQIGAYMDEKNSPYNNGYNMYKFAWIMRPTVPFYANDDPRYFNNDPFMPESINILAETNPEVSGYNRNKSKAFLGTLGLSYKIPFIEGLTLNANYTYDAHFYEDKSLKRSFKIYKYDSASDVYNESIRNSPSTVFQASSLNESTQLQLSMNYVRTFDKMHNVGALLVFEENYVENDGFSAQRELMINSEYLFAGEEKNQKGMGGSVYDRLNQSLIGKFNYDYSGKYLAEFSFRYDGSSRFPKKHRWGFFPSGFLGWRLSEESFIKDHIPNLTNLKFRLSYGVMGDDSSAGIYPPTIVGYNINSALGWIFDKDLMTGVSATAIPNENLTWYTSHMLNGGIDFDWNNGLISGSIDLFRRDRRGLLATSLAIVPGTVGASLPLQNLESDRTQGWEIVVAHKNKWNDFTYSISGQFSASKSMWRTRMENRARNSYDNWKTHLNNRYKDIWWGYTALGQYQNYEEIYNSKTPTGLGTLPGDWYYLDWNEDGQIDDKDMHPIATTNMPVLNYGININLMYRGVDLTMNFQGAAKVYTEYGEALAEPLAFDGGSLDRFLDRWHPKDINSDWFNPNTEWISGYYPVTGHQTGLGTASVQNASYLRLKTFELGYTIPRKIVSNLGIRDLRVYMNAYNLFTITGLKDMDPERPGTDTSIVAYYNYPNNRTYNVGVVVKF